MITARLNRSGDRLIIEDDGYSENFRAYVSGATTYKVSVPLAFFDYCRISREDHHDLRYAAQSALDGIVQGGLVLRRSKIQ